MKVLLDEFARHKNHLSTGIYSTKMMFDVLSENDMNEVAYKVANQKDFPGWGHMLEKDATTLWEAWKFPETGASRNHPMFGSIDEWFYRSLLGINTGGGGFEKIIIKPQPAGDLTWAKGSYNSVRGIIESEWKLTGNDCVLKISIPPNTRATVYVPSQPNAEVSESGKPASVLRYEKGYAVVETGSGSYSFSSKR